MIPGLEILNLHAQGGMAEVYRARGEGPDGRTRTFAVKRILPEMTADEELRRMFAEEARIASFLEHPNIVRVYDFARSENDEYFIVMEFLEGRDLAEAIDATRAAGRTLPLWLGVHCAREVLAALHYATTQARDDQGRLLGLIHRDVSPHNIFVCFDGGVKLTDFGVAKVEQSNVLTQVGVTKGKFGYMSPEQIASTGLDFRSDLYNVGILLYEVWSGKRLFGGDNPSQMLQAMMRGTVPPLDRALGVPDDLEALMRRVLSRERSARPANAAALDAELASLQQRHALPSGRARVEAEWRALFGAPQEAPRTPARELPALDLTDPQARLEPPPPRAHEAAGEKRVRIVSFGAKAVPLGDARPPRSSASDAAARPKPSTPAPDARSKPPTTSSGSRAVVPHGKRVVALDDHPRDKKPG